MKAIHVSVGNLGNFYCFVGPSNAPCEKIRLPSLQLEVFWCLSKIVGEPHMTIVEL